MREHSELWWVSVGGNECEPARVLIPAFEGPWSGMLAKQRGIVFTIGCKDGTAVGPDSGIELVKMIEDHPPTPAEKARLDAEWERRRAADEAAGKHHGYRSFPSGGGKEQGNG